MVNVTVLTSWIFPGPVLDTKLVAEDCVGWVAAVLKVGPGPVGSLFPVSGLFGPVALVMFRLCSCRFLKGWMARDDGICGHPGRTNLGGKARDGNICGLGAHACWGGSRADGTGTGAHIMGTGQLGPMNVGWKIGIIGGNPEGKIPGSCIRWLIS